MSKVMPENSYRILGMLYKDDCISHYTVSMVTIRTQHHLCKMLVDPYRYLWCGIWIASPIIPVHLSHPENDLKGKFQYIPCVR